MQPASDKFNYLVFILSFVAVISVFSRFSNEIGTISLQFLILATVLFFELNAYKIKFTNMFLPVLFFVFAALISYYHADFQYNARTGILLLSSCFAAYMLTGFLNEYDKRSIMLIPVLISVWLAIYMLSVNIPFKGFFVAQDITPYMRATAGFLLLALSLSFIFWSVERKIYFYTSIMIFAAVLLTKSYWAAAVASLIFAVFLYLSREKIKIKTVIAVTPFIALFIVFIFLAYKSGFFAGKTALWGTAVSVIKDNFLFGTGFANYSNVSLPYSVVSGSDVSQADNIFLQIFAETGVTGLITFLSVIYVFIANILPKIKENKTLYMPVLIAVSAFILFNFFESSAFISTNMLVLFILFAFPGYTYKTAPGKKKISTYLLIFLVLPLFIAVAMPLYARQEYTKGMAFFTAKNYDASREHFITALKNDPLNPDYPAKLADTYFALYQNTQNPVLLDTALTYEKFALKLNSRNPEYYYQLAWLYHFKGGKEAAFENISKALDIDKFNEKYQNSYSTLLY